MLYYIVATCIFITLATGFVILQAKMWMHFMGNLWSRHMLDLDNIPPAAPDLESLLESSRKTKEATKLTLDIESSSDNSNHSTLRSTDDSNNYSLTTKIIHPWTEVDIKEMLECLPSEYQIHPDNVHGIFAKLRQLDKEDHYLTSFYREASGDKGIPRCFVNNFYIDPFVAVKVIGNRAFTVALSHDSEEGDWSTHRHVSPELVTELIQVLQALSQMATITYDKEYKTQVLPKESIETFHSKDQQSKVTITKRTSSTTGN